MDLADGLGILPRSGGGGPSLVVALGWCGGVALAVSWLSLLRPPWLALAVGSHHQGHMVIIARPKLTPFVVIPL